MFSSLKKIREDSGFLFREKQASVYDVNRDQPILGDGNNTVFYTGHSPIVDTNDDEAIDDDDVVVYVNGVAVTVTTVDATQGKLTLAAAPANDAVVTVDYAWSSINDNTVLLYQTWAYGKIVAALGRVYVMDVASSAVNPNFADSTAAAYLESLEVALAGGKLLQITYTEENDGFNKEGVRKEKLANAMLDDLGDNKVMLLDSEFVELQQRDVFEPTGYPNGSDESSREGFAFERTDQL